MPTPIDQKKNPDFLPLINTSKFVGGLLNDGDIVIYESTVYPGATEEVCIPILEKVSNLVFNKDFLLDILQKESIQEIKLIDCPILKK